MIQSHIVKYLNFATRLLRLAGVFLLGFVLLGSSNVLISDKIEQVRVYTRGVEFDYVEWTAKALGLKLAQSSLGTSKYISEGERSQFVLDYLGLVSNIHQSEWEIQSIYSDPDITDPQTASKTKREQLNSIYAQRNLISPVAEGVLQSQVSRILADLGLSLGGQPIPPVLYHNTPLPSALIVSPRDVIQQDADISLNPGLSVDEKFSLEERVDSGLNVSSLVVPIGGVGIYPTMVQETNNLVWLTEVVSHEWVHNFLTTRPLGINYFSSPELRVMNESAASLAGKEIGRAILERYYPEHVPPPPPPPADPSQAAEPPQFDFRAEMHETRLTVDELLAQGEIEAAEDYMDERRRVFWDHGYQIRKLNQAYFAFYGAYADEPGGAAGAAEDPVGEAVRTLRAQSPSLASFLKRISWMYSFEQLQSAVERGA